MRYWDVSVLWTWWSRWIIKRSNLCATNLLKGITFLCHGSCISHSVRSHSSITRFLPISPTIYLRLPVCTMEMPTKWSRASVISFIKGLGKRTGGCAFMCTHVCIMQALRFHSNRLLRMRPARGLSCSGINIYISPLL